jgi:hypothetical protein
MYFGIQLPNAFTMISFGFGFVSTEGFSVARFPHTWDFGSQSPQARTAAAALTPTGQHPFSGIAHQRRPRGSKRISPDGIANDAILSAVDYA